MTRAPERWRDAKGDGPEGRAGELFRSVKPYEPSAELESRVQATLRGDAPPSRLRKPIPALAAIAIVVMIAGGATAATMIVRSWSEPKPAKIEPPKVVRKVTPPPPPAIETAPPPPIEAPPPPPPAKPKAPDPSRLALESKQLKLAVDALKSGDAQRALTEIEAYEKSHPHGLLRREALLTKVSALSVLDREAEALVILESTTLDDSPRSLELTVLRGELRARAARCPDAIADFEGVLAKDPEPRLRARAEKGLERCRK